MGYTQQQNRQDLKPSNFTRMVAIIFIPLTLSISIIQWEWNYCKKLVTSLFMIRQSILSIFTHPFKYLSKLKNYILGQKSSDQEIQQIQSSINENILSHTFLEVTQNKSILLDHIDKLQSSLQIESESRRKFQKQVSKIAHQLICRDGQLLHQKKRNFQLNQKINSLKHQLRVQHKQLISSQQTIKELKHIIQNFQNLLKIKEDLINSKQQLKTELQLTAQNDFLQQCKTQQDNTKTIAEIGLQSKIEQKKNEKKQLGQELTSEEEHKQQGLKQNDIL